MNPLILPLAALLGLALPAPGPGEYSLPQRTFLFTYQVIIGDIPARAGKLRLWIPRAESDEHQTVRLKAADGPAPLRETREGEYGNHILYAEVRHPHNGLPAFIIAYEVTRREYARGDYARLAKAGSDSEPVPQSVRHFLEPDRLVPISGRIKDLADAVAAARPSALGKAYALYDYVFRTVRYDKSGTGWGRGDSLWVCDARRGNCSDFHSLFISLARAEGIPARFDIGFPVPAGDSAGIPGYHCWAEFFVAGLGWVPVDISEAWKNPEKHDYFFGALDSNRVQFSTGRDLRLEPKPDGPAVNYFIYPYAELDGKPFDGVKGNFSFRSVR